MATLGVVLAVGRPWAQPDWDHRWSGHRIGSVGLWWMELAGLVLTLLVAVLLAGWWQDRRPGPGPVPPDRHPVGPVPPDAGYRAPGGAAAGAVGAPAVVQAVPPVPVPAPTAGARAVRISDAERDAATRTVSWAVGEGRLGYDEAALRIEAILGARHRHEVAALVADLPPPPAPPTRTGGAGTGRRVLAAVAALAVLAAVLAQATAGLWDLWPVALVAVGAWSARRPQGRWPARHRPGPAQ